MNMIKDEYKNIYVRFLMRQGGQQWIYPNGIPAHDVCADNHKSKGTPQHLTTFDYIAYTTQHHSLANIFDYTPYTTSNHYITLQYFTLLYIISYYISFYFIPLHCITLHHILIAFNHISLYYITLLYITLYYVILHHNTINATLNQVWLSAVHYLNGVLCGSALPIT